MNQRTRTALWVLLAAGALASLAFAAYLGWRWDGAGPPGHWAEVERGQRFLARGRPDLAIQAVSKIRDEAPGAAEAMSVAGQSLIQMGQVSLARRAFERSIKLNPEQADASKMLAAVYLASGDGPRGISLLEKAAQLDPSDFRPWFAMGKVFQDMGEFQRAADAYAEAIQRDPPAAEERGSRVGRIRALLESSRNDDAAAEIEAANRTIPDDPELLALSAWYADLTGNTRKATDLASRALAAQPENFDALLVRARVESLAGNLEPALADLEHALRINPNHLGALQRLMQVQTRMGRTEDAAASQDRFKKASDRIALMDQLTKRINQQPDDPEPRWLMGKAAVEGGMSTLAYQCFQAALDVDPDYRPARESLDQLRREQAQAPQSPQPPL